MQAIPTDIDGVIVFEPKVFGDARGFFLESFRQQAFDAAVGRHVEFVQDNQSRSPRGVLRGLHWQEAPHAQGKLVRVAHGAVFDVAVDIRRGSPTFGRWFGTELSADNGRMLFVPPMCAHGYQTLEDGSEILYMASAMYAPTSVRGLRYDDPAVGIQWPLPPRAVSDQDKGWPVLQQLSHRVPT
jgi:dTDP-4-dehydrorhamnose 3,5-epimerase